MTPRDCRLEINKLERWFAINHNQYLPEDQVYMRAVFESAPSTEAVVIYIKKTLASAKKPDVIEP
jgi:hypothetical protein